MERERERREREREMWSTKQMSIHLKIQISTDETRATNTLAHACIGRAQGGIGSATLFSIHS